MSEGNVRLKPCPLACKSEVVLLEHTYGYTGTCYGYKIQCQACEVAVSWKLVGWTIGERDSELAKGKAELITRWNTRAADQERDLIRTMLAQMRELTRAYKVHVSEVHTQCFDETIQQAEQTLAKIEKEEK